MGVVYEAEDTHLGRHVGLVDEAHALGLSVIPWSINEPADMEWILGWGVDGIIRDRPDRLRTVLREKGIALPRPTPVR